MATPKQTPKPNEGFEFVPHPELLMAARHGDWAQLERLLSKEEEVVDVELSCTTPIQAVTPARDSILHVVASRGDGDEFLKSATVIHGKAGHLLDARNKNGDTPLHCAALAGWGRMVAHLIGLARNGDGGDEKAKAMLRMQNDKGETVLHQAVRAGSRDLVGRLMSEDSQLARVPPGDGASPLYLAVSLGHDDIARQLQEKDEALSYCGPGGRNVLHVAVLKGEGITETTKMLLKWNKVKDLIKEAERSTGSTPVHVAASWGKSAVVRLLLDANPSAAYQPDTNGSFPIHVAAATNNVKTVSILLHGRQDSTELRDAKGRTFLHVAVQAEGWDVVRHACKSHTFSSSFMNMQDEEGKTALHLAVEVGNLQIFNRLFTNRHVKLNLINNMGQTPLDISSIKKPRGVHHQYLGDKRIRIHRLLRHVGAQSGAFRQDHFREEHVGSLDEKEQEKKISDSSQTLGIGSVLIATVAFTAAFALPGGYRADDHKKGGTPMLAGHYAFDVFIIATTLAFISAIASLSFLMYAGISMVDTRTRLRSFNISLAFMAGSSRSLGAAFTFGPYLVLAPVAHTTAVVSCAITTLMALVDIVWLIVFMAASELTVIKRLGVGQAWWRLPTMLLQILLWQFWPYIVIAGVVTYSRSKRMH
uniref:Uncharacterized protein n=1 Tax=Aegilops tauschii TaxID=37682 RepID=R7WDQ4_AEGTA